MAKIGFWKNDSRSAGSDKDIGLASNRQKSTNSLSPAEAALILRAYEDSCQGWFWATDKDGRVTYVTDRVGALLTSRPAEIIGSPLVDLFLKEDEGAGGGRNLPFMLTKQSKFENLIVRAAFVTEHRLWSLSGTPQFDASGRFAGFRGGGIDITEQRKSSDHVSRLAMYDALTGLPNRLRMGEVLESNLVAQSVHGRPCAVLMLDLDRFKQVNDTLGHPAGDALLKQVAERLLRIVGDRERIFRLGGDEFQVIVRDCADRDDLRALAEKIIASLSQPYSLDGSRCTIGASIGIALSPGDGRTSGDLIRNADLALYAAKGDGRGCVNFFSSDLLQAAGDRRVLEEDLRDALERGEIHVYYQPVVNTKDNVTTGVEALVRWLHPERGSISPGLFIPIAEESNLIGPLGEWILRKACEDAAKWPGNLRVAVNVSPMQFSSGSLPAVVASALASSGLSPERLELEITEGVFLSDSAAADRVFASLKQIGVRLALDDFGTGYSSLGYLRTAPFDKIKIDQSFVRAATLPGSRNAAIIAAIVALAEALGMETTAEGVESHDELALVQSLRVSHVQGYIYSKAITADELGTRLEAGEWMIPPAGPSKQRSERISMFRKVAAIFGNHQRAILIRNLSETGALVEGLDDVPFESRLIVDFGAGHLVFAKLIRSRSHQQGLEFETPMVSDGQGGLRSAHPVPNYLLKKAGLPGSGGSQAVLVPHPDNSSILETFRLKLGLSVPSLVETANDGASALSFANRQQLPDRVSHAPSRDLHERPLTHGEIERLETSVQDSANPQLKYILALLMLTHVRQRDLLEAKWDQFDLATGLWIIPSASGTDRRVELSRDAIRVIRKLPRWEGCPFLLANPATKKPYRSFSTSWDTARMKADLADVEIDDLRFCDLLSTNTALAVAADAGPP
jgi:diguanylate cyclase (GGDEF)-like protein